MYVVHSQELIEEGIESPKFTTVMDARHWVINHLDQSRNPEIVRENSTRHKELLEGA